MPLLSAAYSLSAFFLACAAHATHQPLALRSTEAPRAGHVEGQQRPKPPLTSSAAFLPASISLIIFALAPVSALYFVWCSWSALSAVRARERTSSWLRSRRLSILFRPSISAWSRSLVSLRSSVGRGGGLCV